MCQKVDVREIRQNRYSIVGYDLSFEQLKSFLGNKCDFIDDDFKADLKRIAEEKIDYLYVYHQLGIISDRDLVDCLLSLDQLELRLDQNERDCLSYLILTNNKYGFMEVYKSNDKFKINEHELFSNWLHKEYRIERNTFLSDKFFEIRKKAENSGFMSVSNVEMLMFFFNELFKGFDPKTILFYGNTPLHLMCTFNQFSNIQYFIDERLSSVKYLVEEMKFDVNTKNNHGSSCFFHACVSGYKKIVSYLIQAGINPNDRYQYGITPLVSIAFLKDMDLIEEFLLKYRDVNIDAIIDNDKNYIEYLREVKLDEEFVSKLESRLEKYRLEKHLD